MKRAAGRGLDRWVGGLKRDEMNACYVGRWSLNRSVRTEVAGGERERRRSRKQKRGGGLVRERENAGVAPLVKEK